MSLSSFNGLNQQVYATLGEYLRREPSALHPEDSLRDDLGLDSLQTIELVYQVESAFDIQIPDEDFGRLRTIGDVVTYLGERLGQPLNHASPPTINIKAKKTSTGATTKSKSRLSPKASSS
ncbi:MAG: acyl carrier protein [Nitrospirota bacterium]|nr:acyl carrier protein [Nitrospirota bacterium]